MRTSITRLAGVGMAAAAISLAASPVAFAEAEYPPGEESAGVTTSIVGLGQTQTITFGGFDPFVDVRVVVQINPVLFDDTVTSDADGNVTVSFEIPEGTPEGTATATASGMSGGEMLVLTTTFGIDADGDGVVSTVADTDDDSDDSDSAGALADTGAGVAGPAALGLAAMVAGGGVLMVGRRRAADLERATLS